MNLFDIDEPDKENDVCIILDLIYELGFNSADEYSCKIQGACFIHSKIDKLVLVVCPGLGAWYYLLNDTQHGPRGPYSEYCSHKRDDIIKDFKTTPIRGLFRDVKIENILK